MIAVKTCRKMILFGNHPNFFRSILHIQRPWVLHNFLQDPFRKSIKKILQPQYFMLHYILPNAQNALEKNFPPFSFKRSTCVFKRSVKVKTQQHPWNSDLPPWSGVKHCEKTFDPRVHMLDTFSRPSAVSQNFLRRSPSPPYLEDHPTY